MYHFVPSYDITVLYILYSICTLYCTVCTMHFVSKVQFVLNNMFCCINTWWLLNMAGSVRPAVQEVNCAGSSILYNGQYCTMYFTYDGTETEVYFTELYCLHITVYKGKLSYLESNQKIKSEGLDWFMPGQLHTTYFSTVLYVKYCSVL